MAPTSPTPAEITDQALTLLSPIKYHRVFSLPAIAPFPALKVSYSIAGPEFGNEVDDVPTILFVVGMYGTRWMAVGMNYLAEREGVRILFVDRPGFGASTPVPIDQRLSTYLHTIPHLLTHLRIPYLSLLASHSAGTTYALNILSQLPHLLSPPSSPSLPSPPRNTQVFMFSPWVHPKNSGHTLLLGASYLPDPLLNHWNGLTNFIVNTALPSPMIASSAGALSLTSDFISSISRSLHGTTQTAAQKQAEAERDERKCIEVNGIGSDVKKEVNKYMLKFMFKENTEGANEEARLCLQSVPGTGWEACEDLPKFIARLKEHWSQEGSERAKLQVQFVFGETDVMTGAKGMKYFENCWAPELVGEGVQVKVMVVKGGDHDNVVDPVNGALEEMMKAAKRM